MNIHEFKNQLFSKASKFGFTDYELFYQKSESFVCMIDQGEVDEYTMSEEAGVSFRGFYDGRMGYAYSEKLDETSVEFLLDSAKENARIIEEKDFSPIFEGSSSYPDENFEDDMVNVDNDEIVEFAKEAEKQVYAVDPRVTRTYYIAAFKEKREKALFNSKGLELNEAKSHLIFGGAVIVKEGEVTKTGSHNEYLKDLSLERAKAIAEKMVNEALSYLKTEKIVNKTYPVVLRNDASSSILQAFTPIFSAENVQKGLSLLGEKVGERIANSKVSILDDPLKSSDALMGRNFDDEGVASKKLSLVESGELKTLLHNLKTAKKDAVESTGHGFRESYKDALTVQPSNFYIEPDKKSLDELLQDLGDGVMITELSGLHSGVNEISGDFSVAAKGFVVEGGQVKIATNQLTIAGNFFDLLKDVEDIANDLDFAKGHGVAAPSLLVKQLAVTCE
ncbi:TldD/PmbA family protein [Piscibacillus sp. B03]|uniref:TldD/PmbA family protein n=1 Tax=Piscibacillus sp. B03 TaxID=3457430 RepID=UPI003FCE512D